MTKKEEITKVNYKFSNIDFKEAASIGDLYTFLNGKIDEYVIELEKIRRNRNLKRLNTRDYIATVIAGKGNKYAAWGTCFDILTVIHPILVKKLEKLGKIGEKNILEEGQHCKNIIGKCSEIKVRNALFTKENICENEEAIKNIEFTPATRPRTSELVPMCFNCEFIFIK
ncbi:hypothetical protein [Myroides odoratimimus]|uniref:hypothetical protein n=1 Tax=Myroides odoratimimus TaxID=76832 RepID=UPI0031013BE8